MKTESTSTILEPTVIIGDTVPKKMTKEEVETRIAYFEEKLETLAFDFQTRTTNAKAEIVRLKDELKEATIQEEVAKAEAEIRERVGK